MGPETPPKILVWGGTRTFVKGEEASTGRGQALTLEQRLGGKAAFSGRLVTEG